MDKYTWDYDENENLWYIKSSANDFVSDVIFKSHIDAEYICKVLNENEGRKNHKKIDADVKTELICILEDTVYRFARIGSQASKIELKFYEQAIEIISNLPTEEN